MLHSTLKAPEQSNTAFTHGVDFGRYGIDIDGLA
jgi:hypothetical protein